MASHHSQRTVKCLVSISGARGRGRGRDLTTFVTENSSNERRKRVEMRTITDHPLYAKKWGGGGGGGAREGGDFSDTVPPPLPPPFQFFSLRSRFLLLLLPHHRIRYRKGATWRWCSSFDVDYTVIYGHRRLKYLRRLCLRLYPLIYN